MISLPPRPRALIPSGRRTLSLAGFLTALMLCQATGGTVERAAASGLIQPEHGTASQLRAKRERERARADALGLDETARKRAAAQGRSLLPEGIAPGVENFNFKKYDLGDVEGPSRDVAMAHAMETVTDQLGRPYLWGGTTPEQGFDCSGLIYYAFRDLLENRMPRTANGMFHWDKATPVAQGALERGDLVFFRIRADEAADHVGIYLGDGRFIQAPRTGENIRISELSGSYWQQHYLGARRLLTSDTVRQFASRETGRSDV